jgi:hypothetical protein
MKPDLTGSLGNHACATIWQEYAELLDKLEQS